MKFSLTLLALVCASVGSAYDFTETAVLATYIRASFVNSATPTSQPISAPSSYSNSSSF